MAVGSGKLMGVKVPENFNFPIFKPGMRFLAKLAYKFESMGEQKCVHSAFADSTA